MWLNRCSKCPNVMASKPLERSPAPRRGHPHRPTFPVSHPLASGFWSRCYSVQGGVSSVERRKYKLRFRKVLSLRFCQLGTQYGGSKMQFQVSGEPAHTRCLAVALTQGAGASIDYRADILDLRKAGLMGLAGRIATAGIIHKMEVRGAFSSETGALERVEWDQSHVMHEANRVTNGECCRDPMQRLEALVGTGIGEGFVADLKLHFGGPLGCTHVNTLLHELSATVRQLREGPGKGESLRLARAPGERIASRSVFFDANFSDDGATISIGVRLTDACYAQQDDQGNERLASHDEVRLVADVELTGWKLREVLGRERSRRGPEFGPEAWRDRSDALRGLAGRSLGGGFTRSCLEEFGDRPADAQLLSALLCLAPGMTQVGVALSDSLAPSSSSGTRPVGSPLAGPGPCYMLRAGGPLMENLDSSRRLSSLESGGEVD